MLKLRKIQKYSAEIKETIGFQISPSTIQRYLNDADMYGRIARKKPWISDKNKKKSVQCLRNLLQRPIETWNNVIWSDESKFNLFRSEGMVRVWRKAEKS